MTTLSAQTRPGNLGGFSSSSLLLWDRRSASFPQCRPGA